MVRAELCLGGAWRGVAEVAVHWSRIQNRSFFGAGIFRSCMQAS